MIGLLNVPYPFYENTKQGLKICLSIGLFIAAFCVFFQPFGLNKVSTSGQFGYGLVSFAVCCFYIVLLPQIFNNHLKNEGWKVYKEILWVILITTSLGIANYFYSGYVFNAGYGFDLRSFLIVMLYTSLIAIIPAITIILYKQLFVYKKVIKEVEKIDAEIVSRNGLGKPSKQQNKVVIHSKSKNERIELNPNDILFLMSSGNYIEVYYLKNNELQKRLVRNNISKLDRQMQSIESLVRCHRSYIINLDKIIHVNGNLQGYQLQFNHIDWTIPVSRSYTKSIKTRILGS